MDNPCPLKLLTFKNLKHNKLCFDIKLVSKPFLKLLPIVGFFLTFDFLGTLSVGAFMISATWGLIVNCICLLIMGATNCGPDSMLAGSVAIDVRIYLLQQIGFVTFYIVDLNPFVTDTPENELINFRAEN